MTLKTSSSNLYDLLKQENQEENFTTSEKLRNRKYHIGPAKNPEALEYLLENELATTRSPDKNYKGFADNNHMIAFKKYMENKRKIHGNKGELDPETAVYETPINYKKIGLQIDNVSTPPLKHLGSVKNPEHYGDNTNIADRFGGKSKRRKSKTKSCCSVRKSAKVCRRKTDNKKFRLPRRFSRKTCLAKKPRGFTMRSSCAPYKGCKKTRKGGTKRKKGEESTEIERFHLYDNPVSANFMNKLFENTDNLSDKDAGIYRENMENKMIKKARKLISNLSVEQQDMLLKLSKKIEESRGGRKLPNKKNTVMTRKKKLPRAERRVPDGINFLNNQNDGGPMMVVMNPQTPPIEQQTNTRRLNDFLNNLLESGQLDRPPARIEGVPGLTRMIREESIENLAEAVRDRRLPIIDVDMSDVSETTTPQITSEQSNTTNTNTRRRRRSRSRSPTTRRTRRRSQ
jgi:hypothetical protein